MLGINDGKPVVGAGINLSLIQTAYSMNYNDLSKSYEHSVEVSFKLF